MRFFVFSMFFFGYLTHDPGTAIALKNVLGKGMPLGVRGKKRLCISPTQILSWYRRDVCGSLYYLGTRNVQRGGLS